MVIRWKEKPLALITLFFIIIFIFRCSSRPDEQIRNELPDPAEPKIILSWGYQLQNADPEEIRNSGLDLVVFDYSRTGEEDGRYSEEDISGIRDNGVLPVAYISIGEAEDYRFYWENNWGKNPPEWLGKENLEWEGNYKVKYWLEGWKQIVFEYLDKIIEQGFSGVYLDIVDGFEYWSDEDIKKNDNLTEEDAAQKMICFINEISVYCRANGSEDFLIIPQNGERIIDFDQNEVYIGAISGIGIEDLFFDETVKKNDSEINYRIRFIDRIAGSDKYVFSIDYVDNGSGYSGINKERIDLYFKYCLDKNYLPYPGISDRELDELNIISEKIDTSRF